MPRRTPPWNRNLRRPGPKPRRKRHSHRSITRTRPFAFHVRLSLAERSLLALVSKHVKPRVHPSTFVRSVGLMEAAQLLGIELASPPSYSIPPEATKDLLSHLRDPNFEASEGSDAA